MSEGWQRRVRSALARRAGAGCRCPTNSSLLLVSDAQQVASPRSVEPMDCARPVGGLTRRVTPCGPVTLTEFEGRGRGGEGSVQRAGGKHEARRNPRLGPAGVKTRTVQAVPGRCLHRGLGFPAVGEDPLHDGLGVGPCGHDRGPLDDGAAGGMSSRQASEQRPNRGVVHAYHATPDPGRIVSGRNRRSGASRADPWGLDVSPRAREPPKCVRAEA
jgi:hypothetical protein